MSTVDLYGVDMDRYADILDRMIALGVAWKGASLSTDEQELFGHLIRQVANESADAKGAIQAIYDSMSIANATGAGLDNLLELVNLFRQSAAPSTATVTFTADSATTVPAWTVVRTAANVYFATDEELVFLAAGDGDAAVTCTEDGPNNAAIGEINVIVNSVSGITAVTNAAAAIPGRFRETEAEVKVRHAAAVATSGERDSASVSEAVGAVTGVSAVLIDDESYPVEIYVIGGSDEDVAAAIDGQLTVGIQTSGTTEVEVYSVATRQTRTIEFTRGADVDVYIGLTIHVTGLFPADGDAQIKSAIADIFDGLNLGDDVLYLRIPGAVYTVPGAIIQALTLGTSPAPVGTVDIPMSNTQRAVVDAANIVIAHV